jgi:hypothetical protein
MKKIDLGQTITILANIGVIGGILLLAYELRQNNSLMSAQARFNRLTISTGSFISIAENPDLAQALVKSNSDPDSLAATEETQLSAQFWRVLRNQEWTFFELPREQLPVEEWRYLPSRFPYWCVTWTGRKNELNPEFVQFLEKDVGIACE